MMNDSVDIQEVPDQVQSPHAYVFNAFVAPDIFVSGDVRRKIEIILDLTCSLVVSFIGIFTNVIVIMVFARQGFKDSVGISMTTIAIWDLIKCVSAVLQRMTGPISLFSPADAESWTNISVVVFNYLVSFSTYVTSVLAAYVAVERCLCITIPLKVKWLITPKVSLTVCIVISVTIFGWFCVIFGIYDVYWVYHPTYSQLVAMYRQNAFSSNNTVLFQYYNLSGIFWPLMSLFIIVVTTTIISYKLRQASAFRFKDKKKAGASEVDANSKLSAPGGMSKRDQQVVKMLLVIIAIYIVSLTPREAIYITKYFTYEFYFQRKYHNIFTTICYIGFFFDYVNGSVNLFVFLAMSSSFRATFLDIFGRWRKNIKG